MTLNPLDIPLHIRTIDDMLESISQPTRLGTKPGLERVRLLLAALSNPEVGLPVIHVGGTSGKGSTAMIIAAILRAAGYRVGLHAKPHLRSVEERFVIDGAPISSADLFALLDGIAPVAREVRPSWHELTTALMLAYFRRSGVDVAVVEVGLGGTHDSTNVVQPLVTVLTNVGLDHTEVLGDTVETIARDKVGIIKRGARVVTGVKQPSVAGIVRERATECGAPAQYLGVDVDYQLIDASDTGSSFDLRVGGRILTDLRLRLVGRHQVENAALAVAAALALEESGYAIGEVAIREALATVRVPGRIEAVRATPTVVLDGAHNPDKMAALASALRENFRWRRLIGVLAFKRGHDHLSTLAEIAPLLDEVWLTRFAATTDFGRDASQDIDELSGCWESLAPRGRLHREPDPFAAVSSALAAAEPDDLVVITGSLYLVGQLRDWLLAGP